MKSRETNPYTVKKEGEMVQILAYSLSQGRRLDPAPPGLGLAGDLFVRGELHPLRRHHSEPVRSLRSRAQTASVWGISSFYVLRPMCRDTHEGETSGGPGGNCTRPSTLCLCDTGPLTPLRYCCPKLKYLPRGRGAHV